MTFYSTHLKADAEPVLVPESFSWAAFFFGPLWLAAHRVWIPAILSAGAIGLIAGLTSGALMALLLFGTAWILGLTGNDMRCWALEHRGYVLIHVFAGEDEIAAMRRLLDHRPDLRTRYRPEFA